MGREGGREGEKEQRGNDERQTETHKDGERKNKIESRSNNS